MYNVYIPLSNNKVHVDTKGNLTQEVFAYLNGFGIGKYATFTMEYWQIVKAAEHENFAWVHRFYVDYEGPEYTIAGSHFFFTSSEHAVLFKLTWGGNA